MTERGDPTAPQGVSPWEIAHLYEPKQDAAALAIGLAQGRLERLEEYGLLEEKPAAVAEATAARDRAEATQESLQNAGRAALGVIGDFPAADFLQAQLKIGRHRAPEAAADGILARIADLNEYMTEAPDPVVLVVGGMSPNNPGKGEAPTIYFLQPEGAGDTAGTDGGAAEPAEPAVSLVRRGADHHLDLTASRAYEMTLMPTALQRLRRRYGQETPASQMDDPIQDVVFVSSPDEARGLFETHYVPHIGESGPLAHGEGRTEAMPPTVVYGEALETFVGMFGQEAKHLRLGLFGTMQKLDKRYLGPAMEAGLERDSMRQSFCTELAKLCAATGTTGNGDPNTYMLLTPEVKEFLGVTDQDVIDKLGWWLEDVAEVRFSGRRAVIDTLDSWVGVDKAWQHMGEKLADLGFNNAAYYLLDPSEAARSVNSIERRILTNELEHVTSRSSRRRLQRAISQH